MTKSKVKMLDNVTIRVTANVNFVVNLLTVILSFKQKVLNISQ